MKILLVQIEEAHQEMFPRMSLHPDGFAGMSPTALVLLNSQIDIHFEAVREEKELVFQKEVVF
jgi:hypothetical protein